MPLLVLRATRALGCFVASLLATAWETLAFGERFYAAFGKGISNTRHVVVACASSRPSASRKCASAVAARRPQLSTRPSARIGPVSLVIALMKLILNSSVV